MTADENFFPGRFVYEFAVHYRHFERYMRALKVLGKLGKHEIWLDCACGSGYGSHLLSGFAEKVIGFDINREAIAYAKIKYSHGGCIFYSEKESFKDILFDAVISIETIEHMPKLEAEPFLIDIRKQMKENAVLVITTPIVTISNPEPTNPFHRYEYSYGEFQELLLEAGFFIDDYIADTVTFTDGETKDQGYFRCRICAG
ncbi:MAG: class I SAM-dependent methyltransferase [Proteobacteria bacterium]|nr:class I SAM-dependent methyltransferase [Pseudomonadota bacterium]